MQHLLYRATSKVNDYKIRKHDEEDICSCCGIHVTAGVPALWLPLAPYVVKGLDRVYYDREMYTGTVAASHKGVLLKVVRYQNGAITASKQVVR